MASFLSAQLKKSRHAFACLLFLDVLLMKRIGFRTPKAKFRGKTYPRGLVFGFAPSVGS